MGFKTEYKLSELIDLVSEKVPVLDISLSRYVSTENMLPNLGGIICADKLPASTNVNAFKTSDTLFSNIRTYFRKVWLAKFEGGASADVLIFRSKDTNKLDPIYLYYLISDQKFIDYSDLTSKGAKMPRGDKSAIGMYKVNLPSIDEQKRIANILLYFDKKIELNTQINQTLENIAQAIFKSWFVDFDPVKAKIVVLENGGTQAEAELAAMRKISAKSDQELAQFKLDSPEEYAQLAHTASLFPNKMQDSELGEIPEGWEVKGFEVCVSEYIDNRGKTPPVVDSGIPLLEVKHLPDTQCFPNTTNTKKVDDETFNSWFRKHLRKNDILISTVGTIGRTAIVMNENIAIAQNILGLRFRDPISPHFMFYQIKSDRFKFEVESRLVITVQKSIKRKDLNMIPMLIPNTDIQKKFTVIINKNLDAQYNFIEINETVEQLKNRLMMQLFRIK